MQLWTCMVSWYMILDAFLRSNQVIIKLNFLTFDWVWQKAWSNQSNLRKSNLNLSYSNLIGCKFLTNQISLKLIWIWVILIWLAAFFLTNQLSWKLIRFFPDQNVNIKRSGCIFVFILLEMFRKSTLNYCKIKIRQKLRTIFCIFTVFFLII